MEDTSLWTHQRLRSRETGGGPCLSEAASSSVAEQALSWVRGGRRELMPQPRAARQAGKGQLETPAALQEAHGRQAACSPTLPTREQHLHGEPVGATSPEHHPPAPCHRTPRAGPASSEGSGALRPRFPKGQRAKALLLPTRGTRETLQVERRWALVVSAGQSSVHPEHLHSGLHHLQSTAGVHAQPELPAEAPQQSFLQADKR